MTIVDTKFGHRRTNSGNSPVAAERETLRDLKQRFGSAPACSFCRKSSNEVRFVITDPANRNNVCESCGDECVRRFAITCVC
jgi:ribosomal protein L37AE/L43A